MKQLLTTERQATVVLEVNECPVCSIPYALPSEMLRRRQEEGGDWYCPNGHCIHFTTTKLGAEKERSVALAAEAERLRRANLRLSDDLMTNAKELRRIKRRAHAGLCTICNRHFANVERHNETQHPDVK